MGSIRRLGVSRALVAGEWIDGDVSVDPDGLVEAVGLACAGSSSLVAVPGFVDLQCNGYAGADFRLASTADFHTAGEAMASSGVVAYRPTLFSMTLDGYEAALAVIAEVAGPGSTFSAQPLAAHLEGPFLSETWAGAHDRHTFRDPDVAVLDRLLRAGPVGMVTLAPELPGAAELIAALGRASVTVALGHTDATAAETTTAIDRGATFVTHVFNAHRRFTSRDPGPAGVALTDPRCVIGLIADGHHLASETVRLAFAAAAGRIAVVTDAIAPTATDASEWAIGGARVEIAEGRATLADGTPAGTLAGSVVTMDESLRRLVEMGVELVDALVAVSTTPGRFAGLGPHDLRPGSAARAVVLDDGLRVQSAT